jgi:serine/threonine protein kinase
MNRKVAVKRIKLREILRTGTGIAQLEREIRLMRRFNHPNILKLLEVLYDEHRAEVHLILEYAAKGSVAGYIDRGQRLSTAAIFAILSQAIAALQYLHRLGFVHQDIKPANILLDASGRAFLADFGIGHSFASAGMVIGSPAFQAPEALDDPSDDNNDSDFGDGPQKEDVWALGVSLYQMLFMELPYTGGNVFEVVNDIRARPLEIPEGTDPVVAKLLRGMLCIEPGTRFGIDELAKHPLLAKIGEYQLPECPPVVQKEGVVVNCPAQVCGEGFLFPNLQMCAPRRFSYGLSSPHGGRSGKGRRRSPRSQTQ